MSAQRPDLEQAKVWIDAARQLEAAARYVRTMASFGPTDDLVANILANINAALARIPDGGVR